MSCDPIDLSDPKVQLRDIARKLFSTTSVPGGLLPEFVGSPQPNRGGLGTGKCACGNRISANKIGCLSCNEKLLAESEKFKLMRRIWNSVPRVKCKGLCQVECSNVPVTPVEARYIQIRTQFELPVHGHGKLAGYAEDLHQFPTLGHNSEPCEFLDELGNCSIYNDRPFICRSYGHDIDSLRCNYGCEVEEVMSGEKLSHLLRSLMRMG